MAGVGFLQSLWEKPIWKCVWPFLDPMDSVCLRTASMDRNAPAKYGPNGELFFFLIHKEPATEPVGETFSPFFNADIRTHPREVCAPCLAHNFETRKRAKTNWIRKITQKKVWTIRKITKKKKKRKSA